MILQDMILLTIFIETFPVHIVLLVRTFAVVIRLYTLLVLVLSRWLLNHRALLFLVGRWALRPLVVVVLLVLVHQKLIDFNCIMVRATSLKSPLKNDC